MKRIFKALFEISIVAITVMVLVRTIVFIKYEELEDIKNQLALCFMIATLIFLVSTNYDMYKENQKDKQNKEE